jgi:hypothetical protein
VYGVDPRGEYDLFDKRVIRAAVDAGSLSATRDEYAGGTGGQERWTDEVRARGSRGD